MKRDDIRRHLQPYSILRRRRTTINNAFASALAQHDDYNEIEQQVRQAIEGLGDDSSGHLLCFYCDMELAETWDHVYGLVKDGRYAGYGHTLGNLVPCCKLCNSRKGNKDWQQFLRSTIHDTGKLSAKIERLQNHIECYGHARIDQKDMQALFPEDMAEFERIRQEILNLMERADRVAAEIRRKAQVYVKEYTEADP